METNVKAIELKDLWRRYKADGDERARERLVVAYSPLVKYVAGRMASGLPAHVEEADLISYGLVGLISAIERFDPEREIKFETYAITRISGAIIDELRSLDWVPRSVRARAREIERANVKLEHKLQRAPTDEEMAAELGHRRSRSSRRRCSRSPTRRSPRSTSCGRCRTPAATRSRCSTRSRTRARPTRPRSWTPTDLKDRIADAIARLPEREKLVIALYYYENLTLREIGEVLGVTESRVSQLHTKAVLRLRSRLSGGARRPTGGRQPRAPGTGLAARAGSEERRPTHAQARRPHPQRRPRRPPRQREDLAARGAAVRGRGDQPAGLGGRRHDGLGRRRRRAGAPDVDLGGARARSSGRTARST